MLVSRRPRHARASGDTMEANEFTARAVVGLCRSSATANNPGIDLSKDQLHDLLFPFRVSAHGARGFGREHDRSIAGVNSDPRSRNARRFERSDGRYGTTVSTRPSCRGSAKRLRVSCSETGGLSVICLGRLTPLVDQRRTAIATLPTHRDLLRLIRAASSHREAIASLFSTGCPQTPGASGTLTMQGRDRLHQHDIAMAGASDGGPFRRDARPVPGCGRPDLLGRGR